jgi:serine/threonine-protein kinase
MASHVVLEGRYRIHRILGRGGMGTVYEGQHVQMGRPVAIKVLRSHRRQHGSSAQRLAREAQIAGSLGHPHICQVYDMGYLEDGSPFVVMERLIGWTLAQRLSTEGALPLAQALLILEQTLSALHAAHHNGVIHRDIKPDNVFLTMDATGAPFVKVLDFGLAKLQQNRDSYTDPGVVLGTPAYMAPEQLLGLGADERTDIFACGVLLYETVTGRLPFEGKDHAALCAAIAHASAPDPRLIRADTPVSVVELIKRALVKRPNGRFKDALEFLVQVRNLRGALSDVPPPRTLPDLTQGLSSDEILVTIDEEPTLS